MTELELFKRLKKHANMFEKAEILNKLLECGYTQKTLGDKLGIAQPTIANKIRLLNLPQDVKQYILDNEISANHARAILSLKKSQYMPAIKYIYERQLTTRAAEKYARELSDRKGKAEIKRKKKFIAKVLKEIEKLKNTGINVASKAFKKDGYEDVLIRIYR